MEQIFRLPTFDVLIYLLPGITHILRTCVTALGSPELVVQQAKVPNDETITSITTPGCSPS